MANDKIVKDAQKAAARLERSLSNRGARREVKRILSNRNN